MATPITLYTDIGTDYEGSYLDGITLDATSIYCADEDRIIKIPVGGGPAVVLANASGATTGATCSAPGARARS